MFDKALTPEQEERHRLVANRKWLNENFQQVQQEHADRWIAVLDQSVAATNVDVEIVKQQVGDRLGETVLMRVPPGPIPTPI